MAKTNFIVGFIKKQEDQKGTRYLFDVQVEGRPYTNYSCSLNKSGEIVSYSKEFQILGEENPELKKEILERCNEQLKQLEEFV